MPADEELITSVVRDYYEGWYDADIHRMERALHTDLVKRSSARDQGATLSFITKQQMVEYTGKGEGKADGADRALDIEIQRQRHPLPGAAANLPQGPQSVLIGQGKGKAQREIRRKRRHRAALCRLSRPHRTTQRSLRAVQRILGLNVALEGSNNDEDNFEDSNGPPGRIGSGWPGIGGGHVRPATRSGPRLASA